MLDIGWTELLLIAVVAIVVIGPKDLPDALRTLGRMVTKVRRMAGDFQGQFNQAIREANLEDVKKDFDDIRSSASLLKGGIGGSLAAATKGLEAAIAAPATPTIATPATPPAESAPLIDTGLTSSAPVAPSHPVEAAEAEPEAAPEPIPSAFATSPAFRK